MKVDFTNVKKKKKVLRAMKFHEERALPVTGGSIRGKVMADVPSKTEKARWRRV